MSLKGLIPFCFLIQFAFVSTTWAASADPSAVLAIVSANKLILERNRHHIVNAVQSGQGFQDGSGKKQKLIPSSKYAKDLLFLSDCASFLVRPSVLVTAGHCVKNPKTFCHNYRLVQGYKGTSFVHGGSFSKKQVLTCAAVIPIGSGDVNNPNGVDLAFIKLNQSLKVKSLFEFVPYSDINQRKKVEVRGYPVGSSMKKSGSAGFKKKGNYFEAAISVEAGFSGGPVTYRGTNQVVGVAAYAKSWNLKTFVEVKGCPREQKEVCVDVNSSRRVGFFALSNINDKDAFLGFQKYLDVLEDL